MAPALILASRSPQRRAILEQLGVAFQVVVSEAEELTEGVPEQVVIENARRKALRVAGDLERRPTAEMVVLGVDTEVAIGERVFGKPRSRSAADRMLRELAGRTHRVLSGLCVVRGELVQTALTVTEVSFRELHEPTLRWYLDSEEWLERAGGYAIQGRGAALVASVDGDYLNVVGLPVTTLQDLVPDLLADG